MATSPQPRETEPPPQEETRERTLRLLRAVSDELGALSQDIVRLGEALSGEMLAIRRTGRMHDLQSFDLIAQSAQSHAQLLHALINTMSQSEAAASLETLIEIIPFHGVRGRLNAALNGEMQQASGEDASDDGADWF